jgi:hypothetical protein
MRGIAVVRGTADAGACLGGPKVHSNVPDNGSLRFPRGPFFHAYLTTDSAHRAFTATGTICTEYFLDAVQVPSVIASAQSVTGRASHPNSSGLRQALW